MRKIKTNRKSGLHAYVGGQVILAQRLKYNREDKIELTNGDDVSPLDYLLFDQKSNAVVGYGSCGNGNYVATNKEEATRLIQFLKECYQI